jgi:hypothetical protein
LIWWEMALKAEMGLTEVYRINIVFLRPRSARIDLDAEIKTTKGVISTKKFFSRLMLNRQL